jgi:hypothetical protein
MPPKRTAEPPKGSNKIRFVMLEADLSDGNLVELTQAITNALKPAAPIRYITAPQQRVLNGSGDTNVSGDGEEQEDESEAEVFEEAPATIPTRAPRGTGKPRKSKPPEYIPDLIADREAFKAFAKEKAPTSRNRQYLVAALWLKENANSATVNADKIYTCFKTAGWSVGFNDWRAPFDNLVHTEQMRKITPGEFAINPLGEDTVNSGKE